MKIISTEVFDIRVPTSDSLLGSDPFHTKPDYSSAVLIINSNEGLQGSSVVFTIGAGTDWVCYGIRDMARLVENMPLQDFIDSPIHFYNRLINHHQARWLHDGVFRMACGAVINAMWDLWAKAEGVPLWKLLVELAPDFIVDHCIDWRGIADALSPDEARDLLNLQAPNRRAREAELLANGPKAYCTAGWLGLSDEQIADTISRLSAEGFDAFKLKVGRDLEVDLARLSKLREMTGPEASLMVDANQYWSVPEALRHMAHYDQFNLKWVEEPIARDDVLGYIEIADTFKDAAFQLACGEQAASPVIFKQLLKSRAIGYCQIDAVRVAGVNDVMAIVLMAAKYQIPVCPHGGGIGLCSMIQHYGIWDQIAVAGHSTNQYVEYIDFLQEAIENPIEIRNGRYVTPCSPGWGIEYKQDFINRHRFPTGPIWRHRPDMQKGIRFEDLNTSIPSSSSLAKHHPGKSWIYYSKTKS